MAKQSIQEIANSVKSGTYKVSPMASAVANRKKADDTYKIDTVKYDVPMTAIYDRLNDGSYSAKYENYIGAEGNEERLALQQSTGEKWTNGLLKNAAKAGVYAVDSLAGTVYGLGKSITSGDFSDMYDNDLTNYFDDVNKRLDNRLSNYYTQEEKSKNILEKLGTANFWANDVAGGFAFVGGALLSNAAVGVLTGGTGLGVSMAKTASKLFGKSLVKEGIDQGGKKAIKGLLAAQYGKNIGDAGKAIAFTLRTSNFEAGMEARQNYKEAVDSYLDKFEDLNGRPPSYDEQKIFFDNARKASNGVYMANLAILGVSNAVMFGKKLLPSSITKPVSNFLDNAVGLGTKTIVEEGVTKTVMRGANIGQKALGKSVNLLSKPLTEGLFEEGLQGVTGKTMQNYLESKYNPNSMEGYDAWSALHDSMSEQYTTKEGWNEMGIGMIIGLAGGGLNPAAIKSGQAFPGFFKNSWKSQYKSKEAGLERANKGIEALAALNRTSAVQAVINKKTKKDNLGGRGTMRTVDGLEPSEVPQEFWDFVDNIPVYGAPENNVKAATTGLMNSFEEVLGNYNYIRSQEHLKDKAEIFEDYETVIDNLDFSENSEFKAALDDAGITVEEYKNNSKEAFKDNYKSYQFARKSIEALGLNTRLEETPGNIAEIADSLMVQIMAGKSAYNNAKKLGVDLDAAIGKNGVFDHHDYYNNLSIEDKERASELQDQKKRLKDLQNEAIVIGNDLNGLNLQKKTAENQKTLENKFNEVSNKSVLTQQEIVKTTNRISELRESLNNKLTSTNFDITSLTSPRRDIDIDTVVDSLESIDNYIKALETDGRKHEADIIRYKQRNLQANLIAHKGMNNSYRRMLDTNFFSSKEGSNLLTSIIGSRYTMSDDFRSTINENEDKIFNSLRLTGQIEFGDVVETNLQNVIEKNPNISEREKHRLESLIRIQLSANALKNITADLNIASNEITTAEVESNDTLEGDTVILKKSIDLNETKLDNVEELDKAIKAITGELEFIINQSQDKKDQIESLQKELKDLLERKAEIESALGKDITTDTESEINRVKTEISKVSDIYEKGLSADGKFKSDDLEVSISELPDAQGYKSSIIQKGEDFDQGDEFTTKEEAIEFTKNFIIEFKNKLLSTYEAELAALGEPVQQNAPFSAPEQSELVNIDRQIEAIKNKIKSLSQDYIITETEDYARFVELSDKFEKGQTSPEEESEMETIRKSLDQWTFITGVVVQGFRLSDLIQQKAVLETTAVQQISNVEVPTTEDILESVEMDDVKQKANYGLGQTYDKVVVSKKDGNYVIYNMLDTDFEDMSKGIDINPIEDTTGRNNIILSEEDFNKLPIKLFKIATNIRNYSPALEILTDKNGDEALFLIESGQKVDEGHNIKALYESNPNQQVTLSVDVDYPYNKRIIEKYRKAVNALKGKTKFTKQEKADFEDALNQVRRDLNVSVFNGSNKIATLKGSRKAIMNSTTDVTFEKLRAAISESSDFLDAISDPYQKGYVNVVINDKDGQVVMPNITIQKVYLGFPNLNYKINDQGEAVVETNPVPNADIDRIVDIGYMRNDKTFTRDGETVDTTFLAATKKRSAKKDIPFIVLNVGGKRVAYPVKVNVQKVINTEEFENIYNNSNISDTTKSIRLNKWMASQGIDIKIPGNAFISFGESNVNNDNFFQDKLAQLKRINYFYNVSEWIDTKTPMEDIIKSQISVDINLRDPFHSPKVQLNYDNLNITQPVKGKKSSNNSNSVQSNPKPSSIFNCK